MPVAPFFHRIWKWIGARPYWSLFVLLMIGLTAWGAYYGWVGWRWYQAAKAEVVPVQFRADVRTHGLSFTVSSWPESAGIFNSDSDVVSLTLESATTLTSASGRALACEENSSLPNVNLLSMHMPAGLRVALDGHDGARLSYNLVSPKELDRGDRALYLTVMVPEKMAQNGLACKAEGEKGAVKVSGGEWRVTSRQAKDPMEFVVRFLAGNKAKAAGDTAGGRRSSEVGAPQAEEFIPIADGTNVNFPGNRPFAGDSNKLHLFNPDHNVTLSDGLRVERASKTTIKELGFDPRSATLSVNLVGEAMHLPVKIGEEEIDEHRTRLDSYKPRGELMTLLNSGSLIATVLGPFVTLLGLIVGWGVGLHKWRKTNKPAADANKNVTGK